MLKDTAVDTVGVVVRDAMKEEVREAMEEASAAVLESGHVLSVAHEPNQWSFPGRWASGGKPLTVEPTFSAVDL